MVDIREQYNLAVHYIHNERFEEATPILEKIVLECPDFSHAQWALGLIHVLTGFPHKAFNHWSRVNEIQNVEPSKEIARFEQKLPAYKTMYEEYNYALNLVQQNQVKEANAIFEKLFSRQKELPVPIDFYHGYLLIKIINGEEALAFEKIDEFPNYVKNCRVIHDLRDSLRLLLKEKKPLESQKVTAYSQKKKRNLLYCIGLITAVLFGALGMWAFTDGSRIEEPESVSQQSDEKNKSVQNTEKSNNEVAMLKKELDALQKDLVTINNELFRQSELLKDAEISQVFLANRAGFHTYKKGLLAYKNAQYPKAIEFLERSQTVQPNEYFSDDALFFLLKSKEKLDDREAVAALYDQFLEQKSHHYFLSPYRDEVMLGKADILIESGNVQEAIPLLKKLLDDYPNEWTFNRAKALLSKHLGERE